MLEEGKGGTYMAVISHTHLCTEGMGDRRRFVPWIRQMAQGALQQV